MKNFLNKKIIIILACIISVVAIVVALIVLKKDDEPTPTQPTETESPTVIEEEIEKGGDDDIVDITKLSKDEFVALTWEQIRDFAENRLPNYREIYGISEKTTMNQEEWEKLKKVMFWQLFDQTYDSYVNVGNVSSDVEIETNNWGTDIIYAEPTKEYIESLSTSEFLEYMKGFLKFAEAGDEAIAALSILTNEQIEEMRQEFMAEYFN